MYTYNFDLNLDENIVMIITERRGVGIYPFKDVLDEIASYTQNYILSHKDNFKDNKITFNIPNSISSKITFVKNLMLICTVYNTFDINNFNEYDGSGITKTGGFFNATVDEFGIKKFVDGRIDFTFYALNYEIYPRKTYQLLYHEFNHLYQNLKLQGKKEFDLGDDESLKSHEFRKEFLYDEMIKYKDNGGDKNTTGVAFTCYSLSPNEIDAVVASVYGELKAMNAKSFGESYYYLDAYRNYIEIKKKWLPIIEDMNDKEWERVTKKLKYTKSKSFLIKWINLQLNKLFFKINKTASLYFEELNENKLPYNYFHCGLYQPTIKMVDDGNISVFNEHVMREQESVRQIELMIYEGTSHMSHPKSDVALYSTLFSSFQV